MNGKQYPKCLFLTEFLIFLIEILGEKKGRMTTEINRSTFWYFNQTRNKWLLCIVYFAFFQTPVYKFI